MMPNRKQLGFWRRSLSRAFTVYYGTGGTVLALFMIAGANADRWSASETLDGLPRITHLLLAGGLLIGAFISISGAMHVRRAWEPTQSMHIEMSGCLILFGAWVSIAVAVTISDTSTGSAGTVFAGTAAGVYLAQTIGLFIGARELRNEAEQRLRRWEEEASKGDTR